MRNGRSWPEGEEPRPRRPDRRRILGGLTWDHEAMTRAKSRLVKIGMRGPRRADRPENVAAVVEDFKRRSGGRLMDLITTDGHSAYEEAILDAYGRARPISEARHPGSSDNGPAASQSDSHALLVEVAAARPRRAQARSEGEGRVMAQASAPATSPNGSGGLRSRGPSPLRKLESGGSLEKALSAEPQSPARA